MPELRALHWSDIDFKTNAISILTEQLKRIKTRNI